MREFFRRHRAPCAVVLAALAALAVPCAHAAPADGAAQVARPAAIRLPSGDAPLRIDGRLDEPVWQRAPVHDAFVQYLPTDRQPVPAGYRTTLQIVVEERAVVFAIRAFDPRPEEIRAPLMRRDQVRRDQDFVAVLLDPVGTRRAVQFVRVNAAGTVADGVYLADTDTEDFAPDFELESAVQRDAEGYTVELRLPLLALRYPYAGGEPWRVMVTRSVPRESSTLLLSAPLTKDALNFIAELQVIDGLEDITAQVRSQGLLSVRPEFTWRSTRRSDGASTQRSSLGAELKWRPRADWVFDATLNPDFSQVELDVPQLAGNTRFALSVPEKRPFFLESADLLALPLPAFYSRAVTDPGWGLRATYRGASVDATALSLRDDGGGLVLLPGAYGTDAVLQDRRSQATLLRSRWHGGAFSAGALLSQRDYQGGDHNRVVGADLLWRGDGEQLVTARAMASSTTVASGPEDTGHHLLLSWWRRVPGWNTTMKWTEISPRFRNDNGFVEQAGVRIAEAEVIRRWGDVQFAWPVPWAAHEFENYVWWQQKTTLDDPVVGVRGGETVSRQFHPGLWWAASRNTEASIELRLDAARARSGGRLHGVRALAGSYGVNPAPWFTRLQIDASVGQRLDVEADRVGRGATLLVDAKLRATLPNGWGIENEQRIEQGWIAGPDGRRALSDLAVQWLGVLHLDARDSLRLVWQGTRLQRLADAGAGLAAQDARGRTTSLVFQRRMGFGRTLSAGANRQSQRPGANAPRETSGEFFVKAAFEFSP